MVGIKNEYMLPAHSVDVQIGSPIIFLGTLM